MGDTRQERNKLIKKAKVVAGKEAESTERVVEEEWREWSCLPKDLLLIVVSFLVTLADLSSFSAVCRSWRSTSSVVSRLTMSSQSPLFLFRRRGFASKSFFDAIHHRIYKSPRLPWGIRRTCRILGYTHGHLIAAPHNPNGSLLLVNFFTGAKIKLPPLPTQTGKFVPDHLLLSSSPSSSGCIAVLLGPSCTVLKCFFYCRLGDPNWTRYQLPPPHLVEDVTFVGHRLYALAWDGRLGFFSFVPDPVFTVLEANSVDVSADSGWIWFLAELDGDLLAIRYSNSTCTYDMCLKWEEGVGSRGLFKVSGLGNRALFFAGGWFAGSLTASVQSGVAGNSVYDISGYGYFVCSVETKRRIYCSYTLPEYERYEFISVWILPSLC